MIKKYMKGNWIYAILAPICILIDTIGMMIVPKITSNVIDIGIANGDVDYIVKQGIIAVGGAIICMIGGFFAMYFSLFAMYFSLFAIYKFVYNMLQNVKNADVCNKHLRTYFTYFFFVSPLQTSLQKLQLPH